MSFPTDTIAALATPVGTSAIAMVRASGPQAGELGTIIFGGPPLPRVSRHASYTDRSGQIVDDVLFVFFAAPHSFTGEDTLEITCHGNPFIAQKILRDLLARGCRPATAGEFSKRAFLNGRLDLSQAEAVMDLIHARSERALAAANRQLHGALGRQMERLIDQLLKTLARVEAYIDFPDEDLPAEDRTLVLCHLDELAAGTNRLLATGSYGAMLRHGIKTVIVGEPNVGKSSLLNRLVGRERALVSPEPGTTRDYLEDQVGIGDHSLRLIDTAGLNATPGALERRGIEKTYEQAAEADIILWVIDGAAEAPALPLPLADFLTPANTIIVLNKSDLGIRATPEPGRMFPTVILSALTGFGLEALEAAVIRLADSFQLTIGDDLIAINARHDLALRQARQSLAAAAKMLRENEYSELVAGELREALDAFGQISGKVDNERMLDQLFASFCIGK